MRYLLIVITFLVLGCSSAKVDNSEASKVKTEKLEQLISNKEFKINADFAFPKVSSQYNLAVQQLNLSASGNSANRINIRGDGYYVEVKNDSVYGILPFYGEQYSGYQITNHDRIEFDGKAKEYKVESIENRKSNRTKISFQINDTNRSGEEYDVSLLIFENGKTDMQVSSSRRSVMAYRGEIGE